MHFLWGHVKEYKNFVSWEENSDAAFSKISRISKCFHRSKQNLKNNFLYNHAAKNLKTIGGVPHILGGFFIKPPQDVTVEKETEGGNKKGWERGIWDLCILLSGVHRPPPPPTSPPILRVLPHLPAAEVQWEGPSPLATHNPFQQLEAIAVDL